VHDAAAELSLNEEMPLAQAVGGNLQIGVVAGEGFEPSTFLMRLIGIRNGSCHHYFFSRSFVISRNCSRADARSSTILAFSIK
jgi:hypothetical protein